MDTSIVLNSINDIKEKIEIENELNRIEEYKRFINNHRCSNNEIKVFIRETINKYSYKKEVFDYYIPNKKEPANDYDLSCTIKNMIISYIGRKYIDNKIKNNKEVKYDK